MNALDMSRLHNKNKLSKLQPKSKDQILAEMQQLRQQLGLSKTESGITMSATRRIVKRVGSLTDVWREMREKEK